MFHNLLFLTGFSHQLFLGPVSFLICLCSFPFSLLVTGHVRAFSSATVISGIFSTTNKRLLLIILSLPVTGIDLCQGKDHHKQEQDQQEQQHNDHLPHNISPRISTSFYFFSFFFYYYFEYSLPITGNSSPTPQRSRPAIFNRKPCVIGARPLASFPASI